MLCQREKQSSKEESLFVKVYQIAKEKNEKALAKIIEENFCFNVFQGEYNPIILLAKEGNSESVDFLINKFKASPNHAIKGYAMGGYVKQVNQQIEQGASRNYAVLGYAMAGYVEQVNQQIEQGASRNYSVKGYAMGGYLEQVNHQIAQGASRDYAVLGYAIGGYVKQVNHQIAQGASCDYAVHGYAIGGHVEQVNHQIAQGANRHDAVKGYAKSGYVEQVNQQIEQGANRNAAALGYAMGGYVEQVNQQIAQGASRDEVVKGYAAGIHVQQVNHQIAQGASRDKAVYVYAIGGYVEQVNQQIKQEASRDEAVKGYAMGGHIEEMNILHLMVFTDNIELRQLLAEAAKQKNNALDVKALQEKATRLNKIRKEYQLGFKQAQVLTISGTREWLLQGQQLVRKEVFPSEIFFHITSFLVGLSSYDTKKVFMAVNTKLFMGSAERILNNFKLGLFSTEKYLEEHHQAKKRYQNRLTF